ncbi:hypothetical protein BN1110_06330 [bacterium YEK0313]|nr:hypothetical protein BN1110_06330 [bacterium YEK0313]
MDTIEAVAPPPPEDGWDWGMLEIMGHRRHAGRYREEERFGSKMIRIDVPKVIIDRGDDAGAPPVLKAETWQTHFYSGGAIFSLTPATEAAVLEANKPYESPYRARLPAPPSLDDASDFDSEDDPSFDDEDEEL